MCGAPYSPMARSERFEVFYRDSCHTNNLRSSPWPPPMLVHGCLFNSFAHNIYYLQAIPPSAHPIDAISGRTGSYLKIVYRDYFHIFQSAVYRELFHWEYFQNTENKCRLQGDVNRHCYFQITKSVVWREIFNRDYFQNTESVVWRELYIAAVGSRIQKVSFGGSCI